MKEYFSYGVRLGCSFPSVTLLGKKSDWADILQRVAWFGTIDHEDAVSLALRLRKVLEYIVASFDRPDDEDIRQFWRRAVHENAGDTSGAIVTLSGWLTAFCWWGADGKKTQKYSDQELSFLRVLTLDGVKFPVIRRDSVPTGVVKVPISLYGESEEKMVTLLAGSMGMQVIKEDDETIAQPASGWWMLSASKQFTQDITNTGKRPLLLH
ncbi:hypothetical protein QBC36DRAFT_344415 [Triangularia setosa]|uniref:Uncharacterized protein n=1 Tax=Triangularia setosa TaxID=2587417 RepID=A0AAN6WB45_9PEZI|nr:hypothetical protein QBC36DRAFT_344415 [Podospora setosa]